MCKYCEEGKSMCNSNTKDLGIELHSGTAKLVAYGLDEFGWNISVSCNINYCPMCRKEAGRVKTEQEIKKEIQKHKEAIQNKMGEKTQDDKVHLWIIQTLEWVIK